MTSQLSQQKSRSRTPARIRLYSPIITSTKRQAQGNRLPAHSPEYLIEAFGRDEEIQLIIAQNLINHYLQLLHKQHWIEHTEKIIPTLLTDSFLRGLYESMVRCARRDQYKIKRQIQFLGRCFDLINNTNTFAPKPVALASHIDTLALKEHVNIEEIVARDVELRPSGHTFKGRCPFHNDRTPSFFVYPSESRWWCFGACSDGGDVIDYVQQKHDCGFREAISELQRII